MYNAINAVVAQWEIKSFQMHFEAARDVPFSKLQEIRFSANNISYWICNLAHFFFCNNLFCRNKIALIYKSLQKEHKDSGHFL